MRISEKIEGRFEGSHLINFGRLQRSNNSNAKIEGRIKRDGNTYPPSF
jgi:hypothetical protein